MKKFQELVQSRTIDIYDGTASVAEAVHTAGARRVALYTKDDVSDERTIEAHPYHALLEAADSIAHVCMLDNRAIKVLVAMYPSQPQFVLVRLAFRTSWLFGLLGLLRRLVLGLVRIQGVTTIADSNGKRTRWLVLEQSGGVVHSIPVLPKKVGIPAFLEWLKKEDVNYVVLRFYEKLPELYRAAGDLDILVADEDRKRILDFLEENEHLTSEDFDDIKIGLHSVSGEPGMIPYYPPPLARQILANATEGPAGSRIPEAKDALHSFMYHALYHSKKGYASGIPSSHTAHIDKHPENDYAGVTTQMAEAQGITVGTTMEEMDEYLAKEGWRPKLDTLAKIAETNAWVRDRFFSSAQDDLVGLAVFVLREWMLERELLEEVKKSVESHGYTILRTKAFTDDEKDRVRNTLRGGTWGTTKDGSTKGMLPAAALVVVDLQAVKMPPAYAHGFERFRVRALKEDMRQKFDTDGLSSMHSTDNTHESWEYIETCFPDEVDIIKDKVRTHIRPSRFAALRLALNPTYLKHSFKHSLRSFIIRRFLS